MFKLFQNMMGGDSDDPNDLKQKAVDLLESQDSDSLASTNETDASTEQTELIWQRGGLRETIGFYDRAVRENPDSTEAYQELLSHLRQQNSVAEAYKQLAESLNKKGNNDEAATCYRQAIVIQAVTNEVEEKYRGVASHQIVRNADIVNLIKDAFTFQGSIKKDVTENRPNLLQIELPQEYVPSIADNPKLKQLDSKKIATVEWETAQAFMEEALDNCDREEWQLVANACKQATRIVPEMAEAYKIWGNALQRMNRTAEAMQCYKKAVEIQPDLAEVYAGIARLYAQQRKWQQAVEYFQKAIIIKPDFPLAYRNLSHVWEHSGNTERANICRQKAEELEAKNSAIPNNAESKVTDAKTNVSSPSSTVIDNSVVTYQKLGQDSEKQNQWHEAAVYYRKALEIKIDRNQVYGKPTSDSETQNETKQLARIKKIQQFVKTKSSREADKDSASNDKPQKNEDILAPVEDSLNVKEKIKQAKTVKKKVPLDKAIGHYHRQAKLKPNSASVQVDLGHLYTKKRKWQEAIACYTKAVRIDPRRADAHLKLAKILAKTGEHAKYVEHTYIAFTLQPGLGTADDHFILGDALKKQGNRARAISCYEQAIKLHPQFNEAYRRLGQTLQEVGKLQNAIACYKAAVRHNPHDAEFHFKLGELLEQQNSWDNAVKAYRNVLEIHPTYPQASRKLNRALSEKLKQDLAVRYKKQ